MAVANFEELCKGFCDVAGVACPTLEPSRGGDSGIAIEVEGVTVLLSAKSHDDGGRMLIFAVLGKLPEGRELEAVRALLQLNTQVHCLGQAFARNPATGEIVLKHELAIDGTTPVDMYQRVLMIVEAIHGWRKHHFLFSPAQAIEVTS